MKKLKNTLIQILLLSCLLLSPFGSRVFSATSSIDSLLREVELNNKSLKAHQYLYEAKRLEYRTGNSPSNPEVEYDYLYSASGDQHEFSIHQQFDFPTAYSKKAQLAGSQSAQTGHLYNIERNELLYKAQIHCLRAIFYNKWLLYLGAEERNHEQVLNAYQKMLDSGEGNILDVHKSELQLLETRKQIIGAKAEVAQIRAMLSALNGGEVMYPNDTAYPYYGEIAAFELLESAYEAVDPLRQSLEQEKKIAEKQIELQRAMQLPKIEVGYHFQGILEQQFHGIHTGISIPLWEDRNRLKQQKVKLLSTEWEIEEHKHEHFYELKALYDRYQLLKESENAYAAFLGANKQELWNKALYLGEINSLDYFGEIQNYRAAMLSYLQTELECQELLAGLYRYKL